MRVTRKDGKIEALRQAIKGLDGAESKVGWFESSKYETGEPVAGVAYVQEFGSPKRGIPPRPFFRPTIEEKKGEWAKTAEKISRAVVQGKIQPSQMSEAVASAAEGHVRATITKLTNPALSPVTVELRRRRRAGETITGKTVGDAAKAAKSAFFVGGSGSEAKPLVDSGYMLATLTSEYEGKK